MIFSHLKESCIHSGWNRTCSFCLGAVLCVMVLCVQKWFSVYRRGKVKDDIYLLFLFLLTYHRKKLAPHFLKFGNYFCIWMEICIWSALILSGQNNIILLFCLAGLKWNHSLWCFELTVCSNNWARNCLNGIDFYTPDGFKVSMSPLPHQDNELYYIQLRNGFSSYYQFAAVTHAKIVFLVFFSLFWALFPNHTQ